MGLRPSLVEVVRIPCYELGNCEVRLRWMGAKRLMVGINYRIDLLRSLPLLV